MKLEESTRHLKSLLSHQDVSTPDQFYAAVALAQFGDRSGAELIRKFVLERSSDVELEREFGTRHLVEIFEADVVENLRAVLRAAEE